MKRIPLALLALLALPAAAQPPAFVTRQPGWTTRLTAEKMWPAELEQGEMDYTRFTMEVGLRVPLAADRALRAFVEQEISPYDFSAGAGPFSDIPADAMHTRLLAGYATPLRGPWTLDASLELRSDVMDGANFEDGMMWGGFAVASRKVSEAFTWYVGLRGGDRLEEDFLAFPILGLFWRVNDHWSVRTAEGLYVSYRIDPEQPWFVDWDTRIDFRNYRIEDNTDTAYRGGVFVDNRVTSALGLRYAPHPGLSTKLFAGWTPWQEIELLDRAGREVADGEPDPALLIGWSGTLKF